MIDKVIKYSAKWCPSCRRYEPTVNQFADKYPGIEVVHVDIDIEPYPAEVKSIPTTYFMHNGELHDSVTGGMNLSEMEMRVGRYNEEIAAKQ